MLEIAERSDALLPADTQGRARARAWTLAALNTVEPPISHLGGLMIFHVNEPWAAPALPTAEQAVCKRLDELAQWLGERDYLEDRFTVGDLMMTTVLRILRDTSLVSDRPALQAYQLRCEARPAFRKALADHLRPFAEYEAARASARPAAG
ncbi:glutathione S-transferase family protein [Bordetella genomosp. 4]|uniref:glutathione S-transferase family protein n=1 Tax=Bordetella genomosp. 4 TaxID=463044 RepID=UPI0020CC60FF|nr:glutathione binding-like protein [Bordetella genomosp. 4]